LPYYSQISQFLHLNQNTSAQNLYLFNILLKILNLLTEIFSFCNAAIRPLIFLQENALSGWIIFGIMLIV